MDRMVEALLEREELHREDLEALLGLPEPGERPVESVPPAIVPAFAPG
jgi:hypothetical protein